MTTATTTTMSKVERKRMKYTPKAFTLRITKERYGIDIYIYSVVRAGKEVPAAVGWLSARQEKPALFTTFRDAAHREGYITKVIADHIKECKEKAEAKAAQVATPHSFKAGDIFTASWGYDQTNVDFYVITEVLGDCYVKVQEIGQNKELTGYDVGNCLPRPEVTTGDVMKRKIINGRWIRISQSQLAQQWDGKVKRWSSYC